MQDSLLRTAGVLGLAIALGLASCKSAPPAQPAPIINGTAAVGYDPSDVNLAPATASGRSTGSNRIPAVRQNRVLAERSSSSPAQSSGEEYSSYPQNQDQKSDSTVPGQSTAQDAYGTYPPDDYSNQVDAGQTALETDQPPPPLPVYEQPMATEANDLWTPGYWDHASQGYYWVLGAWVAPPYIGALWTPGYWASDRSRYHFHHGFWGRHIGFYGGIPYGFGYTGYGYQGGYWNGANFYYNRTVNRIDVRNVRNVYVHNVTVINNSYTRISYNGANGGIPVRPRPEELAALREPRLPPMQTQLRVARESASDGRQFYVANNGTPAVIAASQRIAADRGVTASSERGSQGPETARPGVQTSFQGNFRPTPETNVRPTPQTSFQRPIQPSTTQLPQAQPRQTQNPSQAIARSQTISPTPHQETRLGPPYIQTRPEQPVSSRSAQLQPRPMPAQTAPVPPQTQFRQSQPAQSRQPVPQSQPRPQPTITQQQPQQTVPLPQIQTQHQAAPREASPAPHPQLQEPRVQPQPAPQTRPQPQVQKRPAPAPATPRPAPAPMPRSEAHPHRD